MRPKQRSLDLAGDIRSEWNVDQYELIDFGDGRKLEKFGSVALNRPCPAADKIRPSNPKLWNQPEAVNADCWIYLDAKGKVLQQKGEIPDAWVTLWQSVFLGLKLTPFGHVGVFPEQSPNWFRLSEWVEHQKQRTGVVRALNLFGYTGGMTLALADKGAHLAHVDASEPAVTWARKNAVLSSLAEKPVRWIVEDARKFAEREVRRGRQYDLVVLDPPSFGTGPKGQRWEIARDLPNLLSTCLRLLFGHEHEADERPAKLTDVSEKKILVSAHSEDPGPEELAELMRGTAQRLESERKSGVVKSMDKGRLHLIDRQDRKLDSGFFVEATFNCPV